MRRWTIHYRRTPDGPVVDRMSTKSHPTHEAPPCFSWRDPDTIVYVSAQDELGAFAAAVTLIGAGTDGFEEDRAKARRRSNL